VAAAQSDPRCRLPARCLVGGIGCVALPFPPSRFPHSLGSSGLRGLGERGHVTTVAYSS